jgi:hypothetical protein
MDTSAIENALYNRDKILNLELEYGVGSTGLPSDARHMAAMNELSKTIATPISKISKPLGTFAGDTGAFLAGAINEIPGVYRSIKGEAPIRDTWEDIVANWKGTFGTSNIETPEQIYKNVYGIPNTTTANRNLFTQYGYGMPERFKQQQLMNRRKQQMQETIRQHEAAEAAKQKAAADAAKQKAAADAAAKAKANAAAAGQRRAGRGGTHMSRSREQGGLGISQSQAQAVSDANRAAGMSGWGLADGGLIDFYRYGGFSG